MEPETLVSIRTFCPIAASGVVSHSRAGSGGNLLGNDLGQMRIQFNPRTYRVEPLYRDDNSGLWDTDDATSSAMAQTPAPTISTCF